MAHGHHVAPTLVVYLLDSWVRRLLEDPEKVLTPYVRGGTTVLDLGSGMGFFARAAAALVGPEGRVVAVDIREKTIAVLRERAERAGFGSRIEGRVCREDSLCVEDLRGAVDLVLAFNVVHEAPDPKSFLGQATDTLKPGGRLLLREPRRVVSPDEWAGELKAAEELGLKKLGEPDFRGGRGALFSL
jgi:SAM-dependent methyltransferase